MFLTRHRRASQARTRSSLLRVSPMSAAVLVLVGAVLAAPVVAASLSTTSMTVSVGETATRSVTSVSGTVTVASSNAEVASASYRASSRTGGTLAVTGVAPGSATVSLRDRNGTKSFAVRVAAPMTVTPTELTVGVGASASLTVANAASESITVSPTSTTVFAARVASSTIVTVTGVSVGAGSIVVSDGQTKVTVAITVTAAAVQPPIVKGQLLASNCYQCHGTYGSGGFESIDGASASEIYSQLKSYAASTSANSIMAAHAAGYTDAQLQAIANYLSTVNK